MARTIYLKKHTNAATIGAAAAWRVNISDSDKARYAPFNSYTLYNNSGQDILLRYEGTSTKEEPVNAGDALELDYREGLYFYNLDIYNAGVAPIAIGDIIIVVKKILPD